MSIPCGAKVAFALAQIMLVDIYWPSAVTEASDPTFRFRLVGSRIEATGHPGLTGRWAHELQLTPFSTKPSY